MKYVTINECDYGSTGSIVKLIIDNLISKGHKCLFAVGFNTKKYPFTYDLKTNFIENLLIKIFTRLNASGGFRNSRTTKKLIKKLKKFKPDVIHIHNLHNHYINIPILFKYLESANCKIVWTLHDCWSFTGRCSHFDYNNCYKWKNGCGNCKHMRNVYPYAALFDCSSHFYSLKKKYFNMIKNKCTIVTPSEWLRSLVKQSYLKDFEVITINNGIDFLLTENTYVYSNSLLTKYGMFNKKIFLSVAFPFTERKGLKYLENLIKSFINDEEKVFVLVGLSHKQVNYFKKYKNCIPLERINRNDLIGWYSLSTAFINATLEDNFPTVNIESLACGTPIITFNTGGSPEIIDQNTGIVVEKGNINELIKAVNNIEKTETIKRNCQNRYKEKYLAKTMIERYCEIWE